jgi:hypothetical protein
MWACAGEICIYKFISLDSSTFLFEFRDLRCSVQDYQEKQNVGSCTSKLPLVIWQLFLPINIKDTHWYLAVMNASEHIIQVLDSYGTLFGREELNNTVSFCYVCCFFLLIGPTDLTNTCCHTVKGSTDAFGILFEIWWCQ